MRSIRRIILTALLISALVLTLQAPASAEGFSDDPVAINKAAASVMMLDTYDKQGNETGTGSGFVAFNSSTLVTNYHVIEGAGRIYAWTDDNRSFIVGNVLASDRDKDIAILRISSSTGLDPLPVSDNTGLMRAQRVVAIGSPKGITNTVSTGIISNVYNEDGVQWIQFTAPISPGSSGGALFNEKGEVIGITSAIYNDDEAQNINFAIDIREVAALYGKIDPDWSFSSQVSSAAPERTAAPAGSDALTGRWNMTRDTLIWLLTDEEAGTDADDTSFYAGLSCGYFEFLPDGSLIYSFTVAGDTDEDVWYWEYESDGSILISFDDESSGEVGYTVSGDTLTLDILGDLITFTRDSSAAPAAGDPLTGTWYMDRDTVTRILTDEESGRSAEDAATLAGIVTGTFEFRQDGTLIYGITVMGETDTEIFTWAYDGSDSIRIDFGGESDVFRRTLDGDTLTLSSKDMDLVFSRNAETGARQETGETGKTDLLTGVWHMDVEGMFRTAAEIGIDIQGITEEQIPLLASMISCIYDFRQDGTLVISMSSFGEEQSYETGWKYTGENTIRYIDDTGMPVDTEVCITGDVLSLKGIDGEIRFTRDGAAPAAAAYGPAGCRWEMDHADAVRLMQEEETATNGEWLRSLRIYADFRTDGTLTLTVEFDGYTLPLEYTWQMLDDGTLIGWTGDGYVEFTGSMKDESTMTLMFGETEESFTLRKL